MKRIFSVIVENQSGVLSRIANLFAARGYNIESLTVAPINEKGLSRMTIVTDGDEQILEQIGKQLNKLIDVIKVIEYGDDPYVEREMALIKMHTDMSSRAEVLRIVDIFRGKVVDVSHNSYTIEVTGDSEKIDAILSLLEPLGIKELARTGKVSMIREKKR
ncbi:acetolactate synthase small subunit [Hippea maritima]|uniref:Acetolactate synthase small subunit n=1 Tax=Hippea maritima (strain ATCC 700847 / DSM 10411 / MH2) TaxID=760142 RepID=F2LV94_HIPMA|nr:acetolactate synthase small subunit [Hippea maritima]AEA33678.1 acetolactate synthase, small subunit [Hippea maritima DSM 10411]